MGKRHDDRDTGAGRHTSNWIAGKENRLCDQNLVARDGAYSRTVAVHTLN